MREGAGGALCAAALAEEAAGDLLAADRARGEAGEAVCGGRRGLDLARDDLPLGLLRMEEGAETLAVQHAALRMDSVRRSHAAEDALEGEVPAGHRKTGLVVVLAAKTTDLNLAADGGNLIHGQGLGEAELVLLRGGLQTCKGLGGLCSVVGALLLGHVVLGGADDVAPVAPRDLRGAKLCLDAREHRVLVAAAEAVVRVVRRLAERGARVQSLLPGGDHLPAPVVAAEGAVLLKGVGGVRAAAGPGLFVR